MCKLIKNKVLILKILIDVFEKALVFLFYHDAEFRRALLKTGVDCFTIKVLKTDFLVNVTVEGDDLFVNRSKNKCSLEMTFKDLCTAFKAFAGLISLEEAFAQKGIILNGSIVKALMVTKAIKRLQALVFPDFWIKRVLKDFKKTSITEKLVFYKFYYYYMKNLGR